MVNTPVLGTGDLGSIPSAPIGGINTFINQFNIMSLISQKDRKNVIESIDFYLFSKGIDMSEQKRSELNALLNWIKLEHYKNEN